MSSIEVSAPVRVDISPNWPDCDPFRIEYGGYILNAAINRRVLAYFENDDLIVSPNGLPSHSGLGTSAALRSALMVASNPSIITENNLVQMIYKVHTFENQVLSHRAGLQDQAASLAGGVNLWHFKANQEISQTPILKTRAQHLEKRLTIVFTGEKHESKDILAIVFQKDNYKKNIPFFKAMSQIAQWMTENIDDEVAMTTLINDARTLHKHPYEGVETDTMRFLAKKLAGTYVAWKATGAGGGGCIIFYSQHPEELVALFTYLHEHGELPENSRILPTTFDFEGLKINDKKI